MHILFSCLSKSWGGMEMLTLIQMQQLINRGLQVELLCLYDSKIQNEAKNRKLEFYTIKNSGSFNPAGVNFLKSLFRTNKYDLVHTHASKDLWTIVPALKFSGINIPLILTKHVGSYIVKKDFLHRWIYKRVSLALAISEMIKKNLIESTPLPDYKVILIHNGIDANKFSPSQGERGRIRKEFGISDNEIVLGMMGRFSPGKGHEEFLKAAKILNGKNSNLKFIVVGEASYREEAYQNEIKELAGSLGLSNIIFTGYRNDSVDVLSAMDIFLFPSHAESFGLALAEAMSMELPSVASDSDGVLDIMIDNETGFLFKNKNAADLAEKTFKLISSPDIRNKFGKAARRRVIENFNSDKQIEKIIEIYSSQISKLNG